MPSVFTGAPTTKNTECKSDIRRLTHCTRKRKNKKKANRIIRTKIVVIYYLGCFPDFSSSRGRWPAVRLTAAEHRNSVTGVRNFHLGRGRAGGWEWTIVRTRIRSSSPLPLHPRRDWRQGVRVVAEKQVRCWYILRTDSGYICHRQTSSDRDIRNVSDNYFYSNLFHDLEYNFVGKTRRQGETLVLYIEPKSSKTNSWPLIFTELVVNNSNSLLHIF